MARIRTIKPEFFRHEALQDLEAAHPGKYPMMVFAALWGHCDSRGRFEYKPRMLKLDILPFLPFNMAETLEILERARMLHRYSVDGKEYGEITTFEKHQRLSGKESSDGEKFPSPQKTIAKNDEKEPVKQQGSNGEIPESQEGKGKEEEGKGISANASVTGKPDDLPAEPPEVPDEPLLLTPPENPAKAQFPADAIVALYHELMPDNPRVKVLNESRRGAIRARWKEAASLDCEPFGYSSRESGLAAWRRFFEVCAESDFLTGKAPALPNKPPFVADIDFLMSPGGFAKCLESKYHRAPLGKPSASSFETTDYGMGGDL